MKVRVLRNLNSGRLKPGDIIEMAREVFASLPSGCAEIIDESETVLEQIVKPEIPQPRGKGGRFTKKQ